MHKNSMYVVSTDGSQIPASYRQNLSLQHQIFLDTIYIVVDKGIKTNPMANLEVKEQIRWILIGGANE
jgi:hypothetical protein